VIRSLARVSFGFFFNVTGESLIDLT